MTVEGNHDCDIEKLICAINTYQICAINTYQIMLLLDVKDFEKLGYGLAKELYY